MNSPLRSSWTANLLLESMGGDVNLAREVVDVFLADHARLMTEIRQAVEAADPQRIARSAHALKGALGYFTEDGPRTLAAQLEQIGRGGQIAAAPESFDALERETDNLVSSLRAFQLTGVANLPTPPETAIP